MGTETQRPATLFGRAAFWKRRHEQKEECFFVLEEEERWREEGGSKENHMSGKEGTV